MVSLKEVFRLNKHILLRRNFSIITVFTLIFALNACFSPVQGDTMITIDMGGGSGRAAALDKWSPLVHPEMFDLIEYRVLFSGGGGTIERSAKGVTVIQTTITAGLWDVEVQATVNGERYGRGTGSVEVKAGQANSARIQMYQWYYELGDTGPGGGIIFYVSTTAQTMTDYGTFHYLEAAPVDQGSIPWASPSHYTTDITGTSSAVGAGRRNTALILAEDTAAPAASACRTYTGGGKNDWFLPSRYELNELFEYWDTNATGVKLNMQTGKWYWTSTQDGLPIGQNARFQLFGGAGNSATGIKSSSSNPVRAIRAF